MLPFLAVSGNPSTSTTANRVLLEWWVRQGEPESGWIVPTRSGTRRELGAWLNRSTQATCQAAGVRKVTFHGLRHSHISLAREAGVPLSVISKNVGHHSEEFTARVYAHVADEFCTSAAERFQTHLRA